MLASVGKVQQRCWGGVRGLQKMLEVLERCRSDVDEVSGGAGEMLERCQRVARDAGGVGEVQE